MLQEHPAPIGTQPDRTQVRAALLIACFLFAGGAAIQSVGERMLPAFSAFVPVYDAINVISDLVTATLLFAQASVFRSRAFMALAAGYLFTALIAAAHALTFPGAFAPTGLLGAKLSSASWIAVFWRAGFPLAIGAYALLKPKDRLRLSRPAIGIAASICCAVVAALLLSVLAIRGASRLPPLMVGAREWYSPNLTAVVAMLELLCLIAFAILVKSQKSRLDIWLLLSLSAWMIHLLMIASSSGRYTLAWYFAFSLGSVSHVIVMLALIADASRTYAELALSVSALTREREGKLMTFDAVTAAISHEVGQPLTAVIANAMAGRLWLSGDRPNVEMASRSLAAVIDASNRTADVIKSMRSAFRKGPDADTQFNLNDLVRETTSLLQRELAGEKVWLELRLDDRLPPILADRVQIQRVLVNLLTNAIESLGASQDRPRRIVVRSTNLNGHEVMLEISDTGIGIAPDEMAHIFVPFFTTKANGTGLGLPLCRTIVEEHGGSLWASPSEELGVTFYLRLPQSGWAGLS